MNGAATDLEHREWLETDGLGGFASGTVPGIRTRRYHALLLAATRPPTGRVLLVNGCDATIDAGGRTSALSSQRYVPGVVSPDGAERLARFAPDPWPRWTWTLADGLDVEHELFVPHERQMVVLRWRLVTPRPDVHLVVRPFLSGRDPHALHHENPAFRFDAATTAATVEWAPYPGVPAVTARHNGAYVHEPQWYRQFLYVEERARGLDYVEDLAAPGTFRFDLSTGDAVLLLAVAGQLPPDGADALAHWFAAAETARRSTATSRLARAADAYVVRRGRGKTIVAGYPWFTDWGRDTFIALRGLCLTTGRLADARAILLQWAGMVSEGMLPNYLPEHAQTPEYNTVDAALWYVVAVHDYLDAAGMADAPALHAAVEAILDGYTRGTRHGIRADRDGLLAAGEAGVQLTWMDARVGGREVTPRIGKPVEVQALWLNALSFASTFASRWTEPFVRGVASFRERFWNAAAGALYDVVDVDHRAGTVDPTFRPNQILAVGGLPLVLLDPVRAQQVTDAVEARLVTPMGLRSLAADAPGYRPRYEGGLAERDGAYHQGTVWPWLMGPFIDAWVRTRGGTPHVRMEAHRRFLDPLLRQLDAAGLNHLPEIADGDPPHTPRGCPFQAWSVGEALRATALLGTP